MVRHPLLSQDNREFALRGNLSTAVSQGFFDAAGQWRRIELGRHRFRSQATTRDRQYDEYSIYRRIGSARSIASTEPDERVQRLSIRASGGHAVWHASQSFFVRTW